MNIITRTHTTIDFSTKSPTLANWVINCYGFLLPLGVSTWGELAELIRSSYSMDNPINETAYKFCLKQDG